MNDSEFIFTAICVGAILLVLINSITTLAYIGANPNKLDKPINTTDWRFNMIKGITKFEMVVTGFILCVLCILFLLATVEGKLICIVLGAVLIVVLISLKIRLSYLNNLTTTQEITPDSKRQRTWTIVMSFINIFTLGLILPIILYIASRFNEGQQQSTV